MINILERYIAKTLVQSTAVVALIITSILFILSLLAEAKSMTTGDYGLGQAVLYVLMRLPRDIYHFSPLLMLLSSIAALSVLSSYRELAVMRASGFSIRRIITSVLIAAFLLVLAISVIGEWAGPGLSYKAVVQKENAQHGEEAMTTASGSWFHIGNNFIHVESVDDRYHMNGVTRYEFDGHKLQSVYYAKTALYQHKEWLIRDVVKTTFYPERTKSQSFAELPFDIKFNANLLNASVLEAGEMSLPKLTKFAQYLEQNGLQSSEYRFNFWQRIFRPFASLIMIFLAIPFVLGALHTASMGWRIVVGILAGFAFFILNELLGQLSVVYQIPPFLAALLPLLVFAGMGVWLARKLIRN